MNFKSFCFLSILLLFASILSKKISKKTHLRSHLTQFSGIVTGIQSVYFPNKFLRDGGSYVNVQYNAFAWEKWIIQQNSDNSYCIKNQYFNNYLSINGNGCTEFNYSGCGSVTVSSSCGINEQLNIVNANGGYGIKSAQWPNVYLRMDGNGVDTTNYNGGGNVNCQYYNDGIQIFGYEIFSFDTTCDYTIGTVCFKAWNGSPPLANGQKFLIKAEYEYNATNESTTRYSALMTRSNYGENNLGKFILQWDALNSVNKTPNASADNVFIISNVDGNSADFSFDSTGEAVYWDSSSWNSLPKKRVSITSTGDSNFPTSYYLRVTSSYSRRIYLASDWSAAKCDYDSYSDQRLYYFSLFIQNN